MRLFRSAATVAEPEPELESNEPEPLEPLSEFQALIIEAAVLGFEVFPAGAWERVVGDLEARASDAETRLQWFEDKFGPLVERLGRLAGETLPEAARTAIAEMERNLELTRRLGVAEQHASVLTEALIGEELEAIQRGDYEDGDPDD